MDFSSMSGWDFERYCAECLLKKGFTKADVTSGSGDHGVDIIAEQSGIRFGIQCKLYQGSVPNKAVQEAFTGASYYDCDIAVILSNSELTPQAKEEARKLRVKFWNIADYMPEEDKKVSKPTLKSSEPKQPEINLTLEEPRGPESYEEYVLEQKILEEEKEQEIKTAAPQKMTPSKVAAELMENSYRHYRFSEATKWLYCPIKNYSYQYIIHSISCYLETAERAKKTASRENLLLGKLKYITELQSFLRDSKYFCTFQNDCKKINSVQSILEDGPERMQQHRIDFKEFDVQYWRATYWAEQFQIVLSQVGQVFDSFDNNELLQIAELSPHHWYVPDTAESAAFASLKNALNALFKTWEYLIELEESYCTLWKPWAHNATVKKTIAEHQAKKSAVLKNVIRFKSIAEKELQKQQEQRKEQEQLQKEKELRLQQQKKAEHHKKIDTFAEYYFVQKQKLQKTFEDEKQRIDADTNQQVQSIESQILCLEEKKKAFSLFKKKRDEELNASISTLHQQKEVLIKEAQEKHSNLDKQMQREQDALYRETLSVAEKEKLKSEVQAAIKRRNQKW